MDNFIKHTKSFVILLLVVYIIFLQECSPKKDVDSTDVEIIHTTTVDSIYIRDTLYLASHTVSIDTVYINNDTLNRYENIVEDEMIKATITSDIDGVLVNQDFKYIAKFPQYIHTSDTVRITETKPYTMLWLGGELGGNENTFNVSPVLGLTNKKGNSYFYRYDIVNKTHNVGLTRTLYKY